MDRLCGTFAACALTLALAGGAPAAAKVIGRSDFKPVAELAPDDPVRTSARSVGRLTFLVEDRTRVCTATLIDRAHVLTAHYCAPDAGSASLTLDLLEPGEADAVVVRDVALPPIERDETLGYAILSLAEPVEEGRPLARLGDAAPARRPVDSLGHPGGNPMQFQLACTTTGAVPTAVGHTCDTVGGSGGAPLFDRVSGAVIAMHHRTGDDTQNVAIPISAILSASPALNALVSKNAPTGGASQDAEPMDPPPLDGPRFGTGGLTADIREALLRGDGLGMAALAEANGHPGPRHVLDLADALELSAEVQKEALTLRQDTEARAISLGETIIEQEERLAALLSEGDVPAERVAAATKRIGRLWGELRAEHLSAHVAMAGLLSPDQIARYNELRAAANGRTADP